MRIALLSDIHGNLIALDAILADINTQGGVDAYWLLGDLVAIGAQPVAVLERIHQLPNLCAVRGNTDRYTTTLDRPAPTPDDVRADPSLLPVFAEVTACFAWTQGALAATGWLPYLDALPLAQRLTLPDGTRLLGVHASPANDDGQGLHPYVDDEELLTMLTGCEADLICGGHTHWPMNRRVGGYHVVNLGRVSNPLTPDLLASYVLLRADASCYRIEHRRVDYDRAAVTAAIRQMRHPAGEYIIGLLQGRHVRHTWGEPVV